MEASERRDRASAEAADWLLLLRSNEITHVERAQYVAWLRESAVHVAEMLRVARLHKTLAKLDCWDQINTDDEDGDENVIRFSDATPRPVRERRWTSQALAASLVVLAIAAGFIGHSMYSGGESSIVETMRGDRREVALGDGSFVQVDPETRIRINFDSKARNIELEQGRAMFRVAKDSDRPFSVHTGGTVVRALGTSFAVDRRQRGTIVTVKEGRVAVTGGEGTDAAISEKVARLFAEDRKVTAARDSVASDDAVRQRPVVLTANEQITVGDSNSGASVRKIDSDRELAWTQGRLIFQNTKVIDAIEEFNHYNRIKLRMVDASAAMYPISGMFDATDTDSFVAFIQTVTRVKIVRESDRPMDDSR